MHFRSTLFCFFIAAALAPASAWALEDTDGDGFPDLFETELNTNPNDPASTPTGAPAVIKPLNANIYIYPNALGIDSINFQHRFTTNVIPNGTPAVIYLGGLLKTVMLAPIDQQQYQDDQIFIGLTPDGGITANPVAGENKLVLSFVGSVEISSLYAPLGIGGGVSDARPIFMDVVVFVDGVLFTLPNYKGVYQPYLRDPSLDPSLLSPFDGEATFFPSVEVPRALLKGRHTFYPPFPDVGETVSFFTAPRFFDDYAIFNGTPTTTFDFVDGTEPAVFSGPVESIDHVFTEPGFYTVLVELSNSANTSRQQTAYDVRVALGRGKSYLGNMGIATSFTPGNATQPTTGDFRVDGIGSAGVATARMDFEDANADVFAQTQSRSTKAATRAASVEGFAARRTFNKPGLIVVTVLGRDANGQVFTKARKTAGVTQRLISGSGLLEGEDYDTGKLQVEGVSGSFDFSARKKADQVSLQGTVILREPLAIPAEGLPVYIALGHVLDVVRINAKGKVIGEQRGVNGRVKSFKTRLPRPGDGGGVTFSVTLAAPDLDALGFDSEGIAKGARKPEETGLTNLPRRLPVNIMFGAEAFENRARVLLTFDKKEEKAKLVLEKPAKKK